MTLMVDFKGCNWHSSAANDDAEKQEWDRVTFQKLGEIADKYPELCQRIPFYEYWTGRNDTPGSRWYMDMVFNVGRLGPLFAQALTPSRKESKRLNPRKEHGLEALTPGFHLNPT